MIFYKKNNSKLIEKIYQNIIERSRLKFFYIDQEVEDTIESRFDLIIFHSFIIFQYFKEIKVKNNSLPQNLFDFMFNDFENNLREMGLGDIAVNKKMKVFMLAFYGRIANYSKGVKMLRDFDNKEILFNTINNNIYKNKIIPFSNIKFFSDYLILNIKSLLDKPLNENISNHFKFIDLDLIKISQVE